MRTLADLQANLNQLRSCYGLTANRSVQDLENRLQGMERVLVVMHQIMIQNLEHEIYIRKDLTGEK